MKRLVQIYPRDTYLSTNSGGLKSYNHDTDLIELLGQAKTLLVQVYGYRQTGDARVTLTVYEASISGPPPREVGVVRGSPAVVTTLRPGPITITGPFQGRVEIVLEIDSTGPTTLQEFDLQVAATLILEE